jgi:NADPH:quinone reductase-like Zn-dependent oxidoreductase
MKAIRVHHFGGVVTLNHENVSQPSPGPGELLVRLKAAGVGAWDA